MLLVVDEMALPAAATLYQGADADDARQVKDEIEATLRRAASQVEQASDDERLALEERMAAAADEIVSAMRSVLVKPSVHAPETSPSGTGLPSR